MLTITSHKNYKLDTWMCIEGHNKTRNEYSMYCKCISKTY